jgi:hypothetical protein
MAVMAIMAALIVPMIVSNAYAQTSNMQTIDMSPLMWIIISIIPVFIVLTLLDRLLGRIRR